MGCCKPFRKLNRKNDTLPYGTYGMVRHGMVVFFGNFLTEIKGKFDTALAINQGVKRDCLKKKTVGKKSVALSL
jgi:hypothetical protein